MLNNRYINIKSDIEIEKAGGFWCHTCLVSHPAIEQSPDPRYCQECYSFLLKEAKMLDPRKRPKWIPRLPGRYTRQEKQNQIPTVGDGIMSPLEDNISEVDIIRPTVALRARGKRGPKHRQLPEDLIRRLADEGMGSKAIATELKAEHGIVVSYKTIQRILSGERKQSAFSKVTD